jgi:hypothetical protein
MDNIDGRRGCGFRLGDLLTVIVIAVFCVPLLGPCLYWTENQGRRRPECNNNLRQLAMACHNANDTNGSLPPYDSRAIPGNNPWSKSGSNYGSVFFQLLPFIEQANLYNGGRYSSRAGDAYAASVVLGSREAPSNYEPGPPETITDYTLLPPEERTVLTQVLKCFLCSADPTAKAASGMAPNGWGGSSYACNFLVFGNPNRDEVNDPDGLGGSGFKGQWGYLAKIPDSFPDGSSNTILFAEKFVSCNEGTTGTAWAWPNHDSSFAPPWPWSRRGTMAPGSNSCLLPKYAKAITRKPAMPAA